LCYAEENDMMTVEMSDYITYREIVYELVKRQGKYFCKIYARGESTALFRTGFFESADRAISAAKMIIDDYHDFRESKEEQES
jgi:hypothetical protein